MIKITLLIFTFFTLSFGLAQNSKDSIDLKTDATALKELRYFDSDLNQKYADEVYNYDRKDGETQNVLAQFINWIFKGLQRVFGIDIPPNLAEIMEYIVYVLLGVLALYLLVKFIMGENISSLFTKKAVSILDINIAEEHIENLDLDTLITNAVQQQNFRLAIRYQYLKVLKLLSQKNIIEWHYEKTNLDYQNEINHAGLKPLFKEVSYLYDYIWYGEQEIDDTKYRIAQSRFIALNHILPQ